MDNGLVQPTYISLQKSSSVLILFVMDNGLVHLRVQNVRTFTNAVLILFVMDNGLVLDHIRLY